jgi:glyoxylase-like metal-dependent hydrolase (beta-lactamase superfamily II)
MPLGEVRFREVADGVFVLRYPVLDVNVSLIIGDDRALVIDTLSTPAQAAFLVAEVRRITANPLAIVNTHHHFDHCFGNTAFTGADIWSHETTAALLRKRPEARVRRAYEQYGSTPGLEDLPDVTITPPTHTVHSLEMLDLGGRTAVLRYLGRGHTAGDLVITVDDVVIAGDLVEEGAAPSFDEAYPLEWPETGAELVKLCGSGPVVPGHGAVVSREFVETQRAELAALDWLIRDGHADDAPAQVVATRVADQWATLSPEAALTAIRRGYAELSGQA